MRRTLVALAFASLALPVHAAENMSVSLDEVQTVTFPAKVTTINVGNPSIADITLIDDRHAFIQGKAYGATNILALNKAGEIIFNTHVNVLNDQRATVTLQRGTQRTTYNCTASRCEAAPQPGDGKESFEAASAQIAAHQNAAKQAAVAQ
jgi:Flp pilus assembly secretin CpaC